MSMWSQHGLEICLHPNVSIHLLCAGPMWVMVMYTNQSLTYMGNNIYKTHVMHIRTPFVLLNGQVIIPHNGRGPGDVSMGSTCNLHWHYLQHTGGIRYMELTDRSLCQANTVWVVGAWTGFILDKLVLSQHV